MLHCIFLTESFWNIHFANYAYMTRNALVPVNHTCTQKKYLFSLLGSKYSEKRFFFCCFWYHWIFRGSKKHCILKIKLVVRVAASRLGRISQLRGNSGSCYKEVDKTSGVLSSSGSHFLLLNALILHLNAAVDGLLRRSLTPGNVFGFLVLSLRASARNCEVSCLKRFVSLFRTVARTHQHTQHLFGVRNSTSCETINYLSFFTLWNALLLWMRWDAFAVTGKKMK